VYFVAYSVSGSSAGMPFWWSVYNRLFLSAIAILWMWTCVQR